MPRNQDREGPTQRAIYEYLRLQFPRALIFSVPNELASKAGGGQDGKKRQAIIRNIQADAKRKGLLPGMADLCMLHEGVFFAFEVKAEGNYQQANQLDVQALVCNNGGHYFVVRSVQDVKEIFKSGPPAPLASVPFRGQVS